MHFYFINIAAISDMRAPPLKDLLKEDGLRKSCKIINEWMEGRGLFISVRKSLFC